MPFIGHIENKTEKPLGERLAGAANMAVPQIAQALAAQQAQKQQAKAMFDFANTIEKDNPGSPMHKLVADVYRSQLPMEDKAQVVKALTGLDPFKSAQQERLQKDSVAARYSRRIKEIDEELKSGLVYKKDEVDKLKKHKKELQAERDHLLGFDLDDEEELEETEKVPVKAKKAKKPVWTSSNPEHMKKFKQLDKKFNHDKAKIAEVLSKEYELE